MPTRPGARNAATPSSASAAITQPSSAWTKQRTSRPRSLEIEHEIADPLARPVIGVAPAAPGRDDGKARVEQVGGVGAGAGGVDRRVFEQPDQLARAARRDRRGARLHLGERLRIVGRAGVDAPFDVGGDGVGRWEGHRATACAGSRGAVQPATGGTEQRGSGRMTGTGAAGNGKGMATRIGDVWDSTVDATRGRAGVIAPVALIGVFLPGVAQSIVTLFGEPQSGTTTLLTGLIAIVTLVAAVWAQLTIIGIATDPGTTRAEASAGTATALASARAWIPVGRVRDDRQLRPHRRHQGDNGDQACAAAWWCPNAARRTA